MAVHFNTIYVVVLISDGNSEKGAHVRSNIRTIWSLEGISYLDREQSQVRYFFLRKALFSFMRAQHTLSYQ